MGIVCCSNTVSMNSEEREFMSKLKENTILNDVEGKFYSRQFIFSVIKIQKMFRVYKAYKVLDNLFEVEKVKTVKELENKTLINENIIVNSECEKYYRRLVKEGKIKDFNENFTNKKSLNCTKSYSNYKENFLDNAVQLCKISNDLSGGDKSLVGRNNKGNNQSDNYFGNKSTNITNNINTNTYAHQDVEANNVYVENIKSGTDVICDKYRCISEVNNNLLQNRFTLNDSSNKENEDKNDNLNDITLSKQQLKLSKTKTIDFIGDKIDFEKEKDDYCKSKTIENLTNDDKLLCHLRSYSTSTAKTSLNSRGGKINSYNFYYPKFVVLSSTLVYKGFWNCGKKFHGFGILYTFNHQLKKSKRTEGIFREGKLSGEGRVVNSEHEIFSGFFVDGKLNGQGRYEKEEGGYFEGNYVNGIPDGLGTETFANGSKFEGLYIEGKKKYGKYEFKDGSSYTGEFLNDLFDGKGTYIWTKGKKYEGTWKKGVMNGKGKLTYVDGTFYDGNFFNNQRSGEGRYVWDSNKYFEGEWKFDKQNGRGVYYKNGRSYKGIWVNGNFESKITDDNTTPTNQFNSLKKNALNKNYNYLQNVIKSNLENKVVLKGK